MGDYNIDDEGLFEAARIMTSRLNNKPVNFRMRTTLLSPAEALNQKSSRDLMLKVQEAIFRFALGESPPERLCRFMDYSLNNDFRAHLHTPDISRIWSVPINQLKLNCPGLEFEIFLTGKAYLWESLIDCYGDNPGM